ncbi:alpha-galactosidase, partial [Enterobacter hormaechei]
KIRAMGHIPGLWMAPFIVRPSSRLYRERPDWLLKDAQGDPVPAGINWGGFYYALDTTHPQVRAWLRGVIQRAVAWGYTYLKLDFLYAAALPGVRHENIPREQAYREALRVVREAAGEEVYILACGAPILPSLGLVDGLRIGPDVAPYWRNEDREDYLHDPTGPGGL